MADSATLVLDGTVALSCMRSGSAARPIALLSNQLDAQPANLEQDGLACQLGLVARYAGNQRGERGSHGIRRPTGSPQRPCRPPLLQSDQRHRRLGRHLLRQLIDRRELCQRRRPISKFSTWPKSDDQHRAGFGSSGIQFTSNGSVELNCRYPARSAFSSPDATAILASSNGGPVTIRSTADITTNGIAAQPAFKARCSRRSSDRVLRQHLDARQHASSASAAAFMETYGHLDRRPSRPRALFRPVSMAA